MPFAGARDKPLGTAPFARAVEGRVSVSQVQSLPPRRLRVTLDGRINVYLGTRLLQSFVAEGIDLDDPALVAA